VIVFGLVAAPWPGWPETYARYLQDSATAVFGSFGSRGVVGFDRSPYGDNRGDTIIYVGNRDKLGGRHDGPSTVSTVFDSRTVCYFPTAFVIALVLATGISWRRRFWALAWGLLWVHLFIALLLGLAIITTIGACPSLGVVNVPRLWEWFAWFITGLFFNRQAAPFAVAVLIWIVVTFRRGDWIHILGKEEAGVDKGSRLPPDWSPAVSALQHGMSVKKPTTRNRR
jgi:hypothetical protein